MLPMHSVTVTKFTGSPVQERGAAHARSARQREDQDDAPIAVTVASPSPPTSLHEGMVQQLQSYNEATATRSAAVPPPTGAPPNGSMRLLDGADSEVAAATQQLRVTADVAPTAQLTRSPVDVPPGAVPASNYKGLYDGSFYVPPGTTKRALGRLRMVWCCVLTQESWHAIFVAGPILFFSVLFLVVVVPPGEWFSYAYTVVFGTGSLTCLTLSVTMDPGVIPPAPLSALPSGPTMVLVDGQMVECKVCKTCHILRPPRSSHCKFCDVCVEEFDHHCGVLGSCVAKRTFRFFGGFFIITTFLALYVCIRSFVVIVTTDFTQGNEDMHVLALAAASVLCIFAAIMGGVLVVPCACRYIMLSATNETTKETMRRDQQESTQVPGCMPVHEIRSDSYLKNLAHRLFSPLSRSRIPFDYYI